MGAVDDVEMQKVRAAAVLKDISAGAKPMTLNEARAILSRDREERLDLTSVHRWTKRGARAVDGSRAVLETAKLPKEAVTTQPAIDRFYRRLNGLEATDPQVEWDRAHLEAEARLKAKGL